MRYGLIVHLRLLSTRLGLPSLATPVLRTLAPPVERPTSVEVRALIEDMLGTLREADGVGIAAPRVYEYYIYNGSPDPPLAPRDSEWAREYILSRV